MTLIIMTLSIMILNAYAKCHYAVTRNDVHYAECHLINVWVERTLSLNWALLGMATDRTI
jgi:hypothetical protein